MPLHTSAKIIVESPTFPEYNLVPRTTTTLEVVPPSFPSVVNGISFSSSSCTGQHSFSGGFNSGMVHLLTTRVPSHQKCILDGLGCISGEVGIPHDQVVQELHAVLCKLVRPVTIVNSHECVVTATTRGRGALEQRAGE